MDRWISRRGIPHGPPAATLDVCVRERERFIPSFEEGRPAALLLLLGRGLGVRRRVALLGVSLRRIPLRVPLRRVPLRRVPRWRIGVLPVP